MQNSKTPNQTNKNNPILRGQIDQNALEKAVYTVWQGRQDSNLQPTVLETATLPIELLPFGMFFRHDNLHTPLHT